MRGDRERTPTPIEIPLPQPVGYGSRITADQSAAYGCSPQGFSPQGCPPQGCPPQGPRELTPVVEPTEVDVARLHIPLPMMITIFVFIISGAVAMAGVWFRTEAHIGAGEKHVDMNRVVEGGGVAYKNDVERARSDFERKTRRLLKAMKITCKQASSRDILTCSVDLPEE
jgi:hypothetical protein